MGVVVLRKWAYCDSAIFIYVSDNYIEKSGFLCQEMEAGPYVLRRVYTRGKVKLLMAPFGTCAIRI